MRTPRGRIAPLLVIGLVLLLAACRQEAEQPAAQPTAGPSAEATVTAAATAAPVTPSPTGSASAPVPSDTPPAGTPAWGSEPVAVVREPTVPSLPVLTGIRSAAHPDEGYDRIVFDFRGPLPGYEVRYVPEARADGSGELVEVPGRRILLVVFQPAHAHEEDGTATVTERRAEFDHPMLRGYVLTGDFEAVTSIALGLDDVVGFRVGELPGRIYIDVAA
jgi:hypothetical protein